MCRILTHNLTSNNVFLNSNFKCTAFGTSSNRLLHNHKWNNCKHLMNLLLHLEMTLTSLLQLLIVLRLKCHWLVVRLLATLKSVQELFAELRGNLRRKRSESENPSKMQKKMQKCENKKKNYKSQKK